MTTVVLLGAGASHGSNALPYAPPLGNGANGLFSRLEANGGVASGLPDHLKVAFRSNFEKGMCEYFSYANGNIMAFQRELAAFVATFRPSPHSVYKRLIGALRSQKVTYVTLNYDLLFELAAAEMGLNTAYHAHGGSNTLRLLKVHGSCNFWPELFGNVFHGLVIEGVGGGAAVEAPVRPLGYQETLNRCLKDDSFAPAIAMYAEGKAVKVCPEYVLKIQAQWKVAVAGATQVFIVGVRVNDADGHIWRPLSETRAGLTYFGLRADQSEFETWTRKVQRKNAVFVEATFEESIDHIGSAGGTI